MIVLSEKELNGMAYNLAKIDWALIGHLTLDDDFTAGYSEAAEQVRRELFYRLINHTCGCLKLRPRNLAFYAKPEGDKIKRCHIHFLIARHGTKGRPLELMAATMQDYWSKRHGLAKIEPFDANRQWQGVAYQSKFEFDANGNRLEPYEYKSEALKALFRKNAESAIILPPLQAQIHAYNFGI